jgi:hypothetical protein
VVEAFDFITGTNFAKTIDSAQRAAENWGKNENAKTLNRGLLRKNLGAESFGFGRVEYGESWNQGMKDGAAGKKALGDMWGKVKGVFSPDVKIPGMENLDAMGGMVGMKGENPLLAEIAKNTGDTAANTAQQKEDDYKMLRDIMAQRAVSRVGNTGGSVKVEMVNNNTLSSQLDINGFIAKLASTMQEAASTSAQGLHS